MFIFRSVPFIPSKTTTRFFQVTFLRLVSTSGVKSSDLHLSDQRVTGKKMVHIYIYQQKQIYLSIVSIIHRISRKSRSIESFKIFPLSVKVKNSDLPNLPS